MSGAGAPLAVPHVHAFPNCTINFKQIPTPQSVIIIHENIDTPVTPGKLILAFADGHIENLQTDIAKQMIADSKKILEANRIPSPP